MEKKKVFLISNYFHFASEKSSNRYRELAECLSTEKDIDLEVITSCFYQRTKTFRKNTDELTAGIPYKATFIYEPGYNKNISFKRLHTGRVFAKNALKYLKSKTKIDLIYQVVPTLDVALAVGKFANKNKIPFVIDVQDLWPEAFKMAVDIPVLSDLLFLPYALKADGIYKRADAVCAVSQTYVDRVLRVNKKCSSGTSVFIGINLNKFDESAAGALKSPDKVRLAYCGSLEKSYNIKLVIDALSLMQNPPSFIVMGDGSFKQEFEDYAKQKNVDVVFTGFIPYEQMCKGICSCDITINPIIGKSVASIINKHGDYAASGLPVINTQNSPEYCKLVDDYNMGFNCLKNDPKEIAEKLEYLINNKETRLQMGKNSRKCAEEKFNRVYTYRKLVDVVKELL